MQTVDDILLATLVEAILAPSVQKVKVQKIEHLPVGIDPDGRLVYDTYIDIAMVPKVAIDWISFSFDVGGSNPPGESKDSL